MNGIMSNLTVCLTGEILRGEVGSGLHGTGMPGQEDRDEMGVVIEPPENVFGPVQWEHYISREAPEGVSAAPGDLEQTWYSLRKFMRLATQGNPSVLVLLYCPRSHIVTRTNFGQELQDLAGDIISTRCIPRFLGYLGNQKNDLIKRKTRPALVEKFNLDVKAAMHAVRLGYQGLQLNKFGFLCEPVDEPMRVHLSDIRAGRVAFEDILIELEEYETKLLELKENPNRSALREEPDWQLLNGFLYRAYTETWRECLGF